MRISIIGSGYVGLVSGACLAEMGHQVICVDLDRVRVDQINCGVAPFYEAELNELLKKNVDANLRATTDLQKAVFETDISFITVGTPFCEGEIDLTYVRQAASDIGSALKHKADYHVVAVKSTVVPGTTDEVVLPILEETSGKAVGIGFGLGMNPEFLREGTAVQDFMYPDRIVIGGQDVRSADLLGEVYGAFVRVDVVRTNNRTAEMIKYTSNCLLATMISFSNEIGNLCSSIGGVDVVDVMKGVHLDRRLSPIMPDGERIVPLITSYLEAGCGFGGSCFPKDVKALIAQGQKLGNPMWLLDSVIKVNEQQPEQVMNLIEKHFDSLEGVCVAVLGLAFKPETDDVRESPSLLIISGLLEKGALVKTYDPAINKQILGPIGCNEKLMQFDSLKAAIEDAKVIVLMTRWDEFQKIPELVEGLNPQPVIIDGRRMLEKQDVAIYEGIGV